MANEITVNASVAVAKGGLKLARENNFKATLAGGHYVGSAVDVPTTSGGTALSLGSLASAGAAYFRNLDATNYVEIGVQVSSTFYPFAKLKPGESCVLRLGTTTPYARANAAAVPLEYTVLED